MIYNFWLSHDNPKTVLRFVIKYILRSIILYFRKQGPVIVCKNHIYYIRSPPPPIAWSKFCKHLHLEPPHGFPCEEQCSLSVTLDDDVSVAVSKLRFQVHGDLKRTLNLNRKCLVDDTVEVIVDCSPSAFKGMYLLIKSSDTRN